VLPAANGVELGLLRTHVPAKSHLLNRMGSKPIRGVTGHWLGTSSTAGIQGDGAQCGEVSSRSSYRLQQHEGWLIGTHSTASAPSICRGICGNGVIGSNRRNNVDRFWTAIPHPKGDGMAPQSPTNS